MAIRLHSALPLDPDIVLCINMGWTWNDLQAAPSWVVDDLKSYWRKRGLIAAERERMGGRRK